MWRGKSGVMIGYDLDGHDSHEGVGALANQQVMARSIDAS
jgi:hypothetical protein